MSHRLAQASATVLTGTMLALAAGMAASPAASPDPAQRREPHPRVFAPGVISSDQEEYRVTFKPNGRTAYFARSQAFFPFERKSTIMVTRLRHGKWSTPRVAKFSGTYSDIDPFVTADGTALYFSSIRPGAGKVSDDVDMWVMHRKPGGGWGKPEHLGAANSRYDDLYPSITPEGTLYFGSDRPGGEGGFDIWRSRRTGSGAYREAAPLGPRVNSASWEFNPVVVLGGSVMVFTKIEDPSALEPFGELQVSVSRGGWGWSSPRGLRVVNTDADEFHPSFSPDLGTFYFVRRPPLAANAQGDLYALPTWRLLLDHWRAD